MKHATCLHAALFAVLIATSCRDPKMESYRIPKESRAPAPAAATTPGLTDAAVVAAPIAAANSPGMAGGAVATASGASLTWIAPADWKPKPGSAMRKGSYLIAGAAGETAEVAITAFPGDVGGEVANLNRWRGQLGLPLLADADAARQVLRQEVHGLRATVVDLANADGSRAQRMLGAMVPYEGATWFFKLTGPDALVAGQKPAFLRFIESIKPAATAP